MPIYTYRREDGTTFEIRQKFSDDPLETDPETGQTVTRIVHAAGIVFKGSGFYVNDSKGAKKNLATPTTDNVASENGASESGSGTGENGAKSEAKPEAKTETKTETKAEKTSTD